VNERGNVGRIGIAVPYKSLTGLGFEDYGCERPSGTPWIARLPDGFDMNPGAMAACSKPEEARVGHIPAAVKVPNITVYDRNFVLPTQLLEPTKGRSWYVYA